MQLSVNLIGNTFFFNISFKWHTSKSNPEKFETNENVRNNKVTIKLILYSSEMKLLKFEYTPLNVWVYDTQMF